MTRTTSAAPERAQTHTQPLVSIGIPAFNSADFIVASIRSALAQTYPNTEIIVVDDASSDGTAEIVEAMAEPRVRLLRNAENLGMAGNHNRVLDECSGTYVKILHADDTVEPDCVERQVEMLERNPSAVMATCRRRIIDDVGKPIITRGPTWDAGVIDGHEIIRRCVHRGANLLGEPSAALIRLQTARDVGGFSPDEYYVIDLEFWSRLLTVGDLYWTPEPLANYRISADNATAREAGGQIAALESLMHELAAKPELDVTEAEIETGLKHARREYKLRALMVKVFAMPSAHREKIAYLFVGGYNTVVGYLLFAGFWWAFGGANAHLTSNPWPYWAILALSQAVSMVNAFLAHKYIVFRSQGNPLAEFPRFALINAFVLSLNMFAFPALVHWLKINPYVAQLLFTAGIVTFNYFASKYFSFREPVVD